MALRVLEAGEGGRAGRFGEDAAKSGQGQDGLENRLVFDKQECATALAKLLSVLWFASRGALTLMESADVSAITGLGTSRPSRQAL